MRNRIYIESRVLGSMIVGKLIYTPFTFSHVSAPPVIYADGRTGLYEQVMISYQEYPEGARIFNALVDTWAMQSNNHSTIQWSFDTTEYVATKHMRAFGKIIVPADRFFYWEEGDPGSTTELRDATMMFCSDPNMQLMNSFAIKISGFTKDATEMYQTLECMHRASKTADQLRNNHSHVMIIR